MHHAKRRLNAAPACKRRATLGGVAGHAVADAGQIFAALHQHGRGLQRLGGGQRLFATQVQGDQHGGGNAERRQHGREGPEDAFHRCIPSQRAAEAATGTSATPPQRAGMAAGSVRAGLPPAATG